MGSEAESHQEFPSAGGVTDRFAELQELGRVHPGRIAFQRWSRLGSVARMVDSNLNELLSLLDVAEQNEDLQMALVSDGADPEKQDAVYNELYRLLHNYLAAVKTMVDHSRNHVRRYKGSAFQQQYQRRVNAIATEGVAVFVQDLRNVVLHHELPVVGTKFTFRPDQEIQVSMTLPPDALLATSDRWTAPARKYIAAQGENLSLRKCVGEYATLTNSLTTWLRDQFLVLHGDQLAEYNALVSESLALLPLELRPGPIQR